MIDTPFRYGRAAAPASLIGEMPDQAFTLGTVDELLPADQALGHAVADARHTHRY